MNDSTTNDVTLVGSHIRLRPLLASDSIIDDEWPDVRENLERRLRPLTLSGTGASG